MAVAMWTASCPVMDTRAIPTHHQAHPRSSCVAVPARRRPLASTSVSPRAAGGDASIRSGMPARCTPQAAGRSARAPLGELLCDEQMLILNRLALLLRAHRFYHPGSHDQSHTPRWPPRTQCRRSSQPQHAATACSERLGPQRAPVMQQRTPVRVMHLCSSRLARARPAPAFPGLPRVPDAPIPPHAPVQVGASVRRVPRALCSASVRPCPAPLGLQCSAEHLVAPRCARRRSAPGGCGRG
jgi:hypothetical protein